MTAKKRKNKKAFKSLLYILGLLIIAAGVYFGIFENPFSDNGGTPSGGLGEAAQINEGDIQAHMIDVGQADCLLVRIPDNGTVKNILIDAGTSEGYGATVVENYLDSCGIKEIEYFIITHPHLDHIGAADEVIYGYNVKNVIIPDCEYGTSSWARVLTAIDSRNVNAIFSEVGDAYSVGKASFKILAPAESMLVKDGDANNYSVVIRLTYGENSFMFTGDAHVQSEMEILKAFTDDELKCDVLKIGHHGSSTSSSQLFLDAVDPDIILMSLGKNNEYGHPHKETMEKLNKMDITLLRTDEDGSVVLVSDGKTISRLKITK